MLTSRFRVPRPLAGTGALLLLALAACETPTGADRGDLVASFVVAPSVAPGLGSFTGSLITNARLRVLRPGLTTAVEVVIDTSVVFPDTASAIAVRLRVPLRARSERLLVVVELRAGTITLLSGSELVEVFAEGAGPSPLPRPVLVYVGPGDQARVLRIEPRDTVLTFGTSATFRAKAFDQNGGSVDSILIRWSTSPPAVPVSLAGVLAAPSQRGTLFLKAETATGLQDSVRVRFAPPPASLAMLSGNNQLALAGSVLQALLAVQVRAADGLPVPGVVVRFRVLLGGGAVASQFVVTDDNGEARTQAQLGAVLGPQTFEAAVTGLPAVVFTATAL